MNETDEVIEHQEVAGTQEDNVFENTEQEVSEQEATDQEVQETQEDLGEPKKVPLEALKKERRKRQEAEMNAAYQYQQYQQLQQQQQQEPEDDSSKYESATQEDLEKNRMQTVQLLEERIWSKSNPEIKKYVDENLNNFLKQRPNYAIAINSAENRYEEAYELMEAFMPRQKKQVKGTHKSKMEAPNSPASVPKSAAMNNAVDLMSMNDKEYLEWRRSKSVSRR